MANRVFRRNLLLAASLLVASPAASGHGDLHESIERISKQLEAHPDQGSLLLARASLHAQHGDHELALEDLATLQALEPANDLVGATRGEVFRRMGRLKEARAEQEAFLSKHPQHRQVQWDYCRTLADAKDTPAALRALDDLIASAENPPPDAVALRLAVTEASGPEGPADALAWLERFLKERPQPLFQEHALRLEISLGHTGKALVRLDAMVAAAPRKEALLLRKAALCRQAGDEPAALVAAKQAAEALSRLPAHARATPATLALAEQVRLFLSHP